MATFSYSVDWGAAQNTKPRVLSANFGNGYEQRVADGLNWKPRVWDLRFTNRNDTDATAILLFFDTHGGVTNFDWTPPLGAAGKWIVREWNTTMDNYGSTSISAKFEEVFE